MSSYPTLQTSGGKLFTNTIVRREKGMTDFMSLLPMMVPYLLFVTTVASGAILVLAVISLYRVRVALTRLAILEDVTRQIQVQILAIGVLTRGRGLRDTESLKKK